MKEEQWNQEQRNPRHVEKCGRPGTRQECAHLVEITQRLLSQDWLCSPQRKRDQGKVNLRLQLSVEQGANPRQHAAAERIEITLQHIGDDHDRRQPEQRRHIAARDHTIVHLQHVNRAGQRQQIDHAAENRHACQSSSACAQLNRNRVVAVERQHAPPSLICSGTPHFGALKKLPVQLNKQVAEIMRMQLVQIDALQHHVVIPDRENDVAVILPNLNVPVVQLAGILEFQLIDP